MAIPDTRLIAVFRSTHETLRAERALKERGIKVRATVKPRHISSACQLAITFAPDDRKAVERIVADEKLDVIGIYRKGAAGAWVTA
jgi:hypothetical protein